MTTFEIGDRVVHRQSGVTGTVVGRARPARSAGNALMQRVKWDTTFARPEGSATFVRYLSRESASYHTALNRAAARGDSDRVAELYAVPVGERADWRP
jgi:hypothetical protein